MRMRTFHTVAHPSGPRVEQYFAPLDLTGPTGPMLDTFNLADCARRRVIDAAHSYQLDLWERERETYAAMLRRTLLWVGG